MASPQKLMRSLQRLKACEYAGSKNTAAFGFAAAFQPQRRCFATTRHQSATIPSTTFEFWTSRETWKRSSINTLRCLWGCTTGDFATMWWLQDAYPHLDTIVTMSISMAAGISTSLVLETILLRLGKDHLPWKLAFRTAAGMSMISMLAMEVTENAVDYSLTGGCVELDNPSFWIAACLAMTAGFFVPLPYNYYRLRAYKKSCH